MSYKNDISTYLVRICIDTNGTGKLDEISAMCRDSLLADEGSAGLRSNGTDGRLSDKGTVNAGRYSCEAI